MAGLLISLSSDESEMVSPVVFSAAMEGRAVRSSRPRVMRRGMGETIAGLLE